MSRPPAARARRVAVSLVAIVLLAGPAAALAARASFTQEENQFMCIACHESLAVAQSQESFSERAFLRGLIAQGLTPQQIKQQMVSNYSSAVLATPPASGFNLTVYVLPPVLVALGVLTLLITIPRWRRRSRSATPLPAGPGLDPADARRLEEDLAHRL